MPILALGQLFGWGTTYYMPSVLAPHLARDLGLDATGVYLGVTIMVAIGGLASPSAGRLLDRYGAARFMIAAPITIGLGHVLVAAHPTAATWYFAWVLHGIAMPFGLTLAVNTYLTRVTGVGARRRIGLVALLVGFAPSAFWPATAALEAQFGWRGTLVVYAVIEIAALLPLQMWIAARWSDAVPNFEAGRGTTRSSDPPPATLSPTIRTIAIVAMVVAFTAQGFASWGLPLHVIRLFQDLGLDDTTAVTVAAASGAATIAARTLEVTLGQRLHPLTTTGFSIAILAPMLALLGSPLDPLMAAWIFIVVWSGANGILAVLRNTLPLTLFGAEDYGRLMGRMSLPQNLVFAASPAVFAQAMDRGGPTLALWLAIVASLTALVAAVILQRIARPSHGRSH
ncbi:MAG: MFS transporter [Siculibacillus sp.]|nr:MFS transporter [Siculibacillus sp.]